LQVFRKFLWLGAYGSGSAKPTYLYCNSRSVLNEIGLHGEWRPSKQVTVTSTYVVDAQGRKHVTGVPQGLKQSQEYPDDFGKSIAAAALRLASASSSALSATTSQSAAPQAYILFPKVLWNLPE